MTGLHDALAALADEWETKYGIRSEAHRVFGPQKVSIEYAVRTLRTLAAQHLPVATDSTTAALVERSSFGTPEATALRASVSDEVAARVVARVKELEADAPAPAPEPSDRAGLSEIERSSLLDAVYGDDPARPSDPDDAVDAVVAAVKKIKRGLADRLAVAERERGEAREQAKLHEHGYCESSIAHNEFLSRRLVDEKDRADAAEQEGATLRAQVAAVEALLPAECWISRTSDIRCIDYVGGAFPNGSPFVEDACCLPCRIRAALGDSAQVVQRLKDEAAALEDAAAELDSHVCTEPCSDMAAGAPCPYADAARIVRERARRVRDGGDHG